ncbi:MAG: response regulator [Rubrivivax sp.]|nr:MAG: response regulator [Rubrivivax sp.]
MPGQSSATTIIAADSSRETSHLPIYLVQIVLLPAVFAIDMVTRLGLAEWILYLIPLGLCMQQPRAHLAFVLAGICTALMVAGYVLSPPGADPTMAAVNRAMGTAVLWISALFIRQVIQARTRIQGLVWLQQGEALVAQSMLGEQSVAEVGRNALKTLAAYVDAQVGVLYAVEHNVLKRVAGFALDAGADAPEHLDMGQGIAGQVAAERRATVLDGLPAGYLSIRSALGQTTPQRLLAVPVIADGVLVGVLELGLLRPARAAAEQLDLLKAVADNIGVALRSALYRQQLVELLQQTQRQSEELQVQQEELQVSNEELEEQARSLEASQVQLENQQAELEQTNVRLEEQAQDLERQKDELLRAQQALNLNAEKLESANRYKSEFLANMSHELRTPLNSSLILAKILSDNKDGNLNADQVDYARTIQASNNDLLHLINEILDLSKIESGHVDVAIELVTLEDTLKRLRAVFEPLAQQKGVDLVITAEPRAPATLLTDPQRLEQILKNLLSNALKFTDQGQVHLKVQSVRGGRVSFAVRDTGVGIAPHQQEVIFEAFRQADGTTSRRYGGTGLGLSISRELAHLLGGDITVDSALGQGSTFTLELPLQMSAQALEERAGRAANAHGAAPALPAPGVASRPAGSHAMSTSPATRPDARTAPPAPSPAPSPASTTAHAFQRKRPGRLILAVEDDPHFARVLTNMAEELDFDCVHAGNGSDALQMARDLQPNGILMDIGLPDQSGLSVLEQLKRDTATRHIPVHMISLHDRVETSLQLGAIGHAIKPVAREELASAIHKLESKLRQQIKHVLVVEDDATLRANITLLLSAEHIDIHSVGTVAGALEQLAARTFDCVVMDLSLPDGTGYDLFEKMAQGDKFAFPPVIVYTGRALTREDEQQLRRYSKSIIIKGARSPERLLDEVTLFLHSVESSLPPDQQRLLRQARQRDAAFDGRHILLVEDDVRNIFALSKVLEPMGAQLAIARNGKEALSKLADMPEIDLVLMDIMMPEMDGLTAMKLIRERPAWARLPIIALTAKAMADDRAACLAAGADDYIAKPIDVERLLSLCRVWMTR